MKLTERENQQLKSKCRLLMESYGDVLALIVDDIESEQNNMRVNQDTAFLTAKHMIKVQSIKDGAREVIKKINHYAG